MEYIEKDDDGLIICKLCGKSFNKLGSHIRMTHKMKTSQYREMFGINRNARLMSDKSIMIARENALKNKELVIDKNLVLKGSKTRFTK